jgi:hypothetical protein
MNCFYLLSRLSFFELKSGQSEKYENYPHKDKKNEKLFQVHIVHMLQKESNIKIESSYEYMQREQHFQRLHLFTFKICTAGENVIYANVAIFLEG